MARALWLGELARAIDEAQRLAWRLGVVEGRPEALDLYVQLEVARAEVEALRGRSRAFQALAAAHPATHPPHEGCPDAPDN